jgi:branched-chain amino acid transport system permease protein
MLGIVIGPAVVLGIVQGAVYGLVAVGLVLVYKSTKIFNFAAGEFATVGAFGFYLTKSKIGYVPALLVGVVAAIVFALLVERLVIRPLADRPRVTLLVATASVAVTTIAIEFVGGAAGKIFSTSDPIIGGQPITLFDVRLSAQQLIIVLVLGGVGVLLALFFSSTDLGLATLATSQESTASRLVGIRLSRISVLVWGMAGLLGGLAGVLLPPLNSNFTAAFGTIDLLIPAFTAAVLGGMTSVPGAFVGGLGLGIVQNLAQSNINSSSVPGAPAVAVLVVLVAVLLVRPTGILGKEA